MPFNPYFDRTPRVCAYTGCDATFTPKNSTHKFHRISCQTADRNDRVKANRWRATSDQLPTYPRVCLYCSDPFLAYRPFTRFCSRNHNNYMLELVAGLAASDPHLQVFPPINPGGCPTMSTLTHVGTAA